jgi:Transcriptional regulator, AbiEi antitoxin, Type IV TA system/Type I restriction enzyme R protein N terminus (HSDR_N)
MLKAISMMKSEASRQGRAPTSLRGFRWARYSVDCATEAGEIERLLVACLQEVPFLHAEQTNTQPQGDGRPDVVLKVNSPTGEQILVVEAKTSGQPRLARAAINQLLRYREAIPGAYGVFIAPYISPQAAEICMREGIGYLDLAGNCLLSFDQIYIRKEGRPNPFARKRDLRSLYSPKAERVLRVLLVNPSRHWKLEALAHEADVSLGQAHNVKKLLADREWIRTGPEGLWLSDPEKLLDEWAANCDYQRNRVRDFYVMKSVAEIEADVASISGLKAIRYAFTGFSGAAMVAPFVRYQRATAYVQGGIEHLAHMMHAKEVSSGANLSLIEPYDEGVFYGARDVEGGRVVSPVQLYLDLQGLRGRGEEAAGALLEQVIRPQW